MGMDDYARLEAETGAKVVGREGLWWRSVRPLYYRPVFPLFRMNPQDCKPPVSSRLGAVQYAVEDENLANSRFNILSFEEAGNYSRANLSGNIRYQIRNGSKAYSIRPIDATLFAAQGHAVYLSFLNRTNYNYRSDRRDPRVFAKWVETIFQFQVRVLGAFSDDRLVAASVTLWIGDSICYDTFFAESDALRHFVSDVMIDFIREKARETEGVSRIFVGMAGMDRGLDAFYLLRGASGLSIPARLEANPLVLTGLKRLLPNQHRKLIGCSPDSWSSASIRSA
jgi:hypothetical protein